MNKYQLSVVIGRFQPTHHLHKQLIDYALGISDKVIIVLGSHKVAPDVRNPFTSQQREEMILSCYPEDERKRLIFRPVRDHLYSDNLWLSEIQNIVREEQENILSSNNITYSPVEHTSKLLDIKVALVGHMKDATSYYLKLFPQWTLESMYVHGKDSQVMNATDIRALMFEDKDYTPFIPESVKEFLDEFKTTDTYANLVKAYEHNVEYKAKHRFVDAPYEPIFITTDAVVTAMGHILLVRRGFNPGKGLMALPGGFLQHDLTLVDNAVKELKEETGIKMNPEALKSKIKSERFFDHPYRSLRGRTVTYAYHFELNPNLSDGLPIVKGGDDADKAVWVPISSLADYEDKFFEDHLEIIRYFVGV